MNTAVTTPRVRKGIDPKYFTLLIGCGSIVMMFTAFTSAYVVRQAGGNWLEFKMPGIFTYSTIIMILSSVTLHLSYKFYLKGNALVYRALMVGTFILGIAFLISQYMGWVALKDIGVMLDGNPSGSFVYVISGLHAAHVLGGIGAITVALVHAYWLKFFVSEKRTLRLKMLLTYWHFVDFLWLYLFIFFTTQR